MLGKPGCTAHTLQRWNGRGMTRSERREMHVEHWLGNQGKTGYLEDLSINRRTILSSIGKGLGWMFGLDPFVSVEGPTAGSCGYYNRISDSI
jgi:hypothetical protein